MAFNYTTATVILGAFLLFVLKIEKNEFQKLPVVGRLLK
jgi:hypothetical protein